MLVSSYLLIIFLGFSGFLLSLYIFHKKRRREHMVCPLKADCQSVINSKYSRFMGVPVELLGMLYYIAIAMSYGFYISGAAFLPWWFGYILFFCTGMAFLFSGYLTAIQVVTLKEYCTWCLSSASICTVIFLLAFRASVSSFTPFLVRNEWIWSSIHLIAMGVATGVWTIIYYFFIRFLKDFRISKKEAQILDGSSEILWLVFGVVIMSWAGLILPRLQTTAIPPHLLVEGLVILSLAILGVVLSMSVEPRLMDITFGKTHKHHDGELLQNRRAAFVLSTASLVSWYYLFLLTATNQSESSFWSSVTVYLAVLLLSGLGGLLIEHVIDKKAHARAGGKNKTKE